MLELPSGIFEVFEGFLRCLDSPVGQRGSRTPGLGWAAPVGLSLITGGIPAEGQLGLLCTHTHTAESYPVFSLLFIHSANPPGWELRPGIRIMREGWTETGADTTSVVNFTLFLYFI